MRETVEIVLGETRNKASAIVYTDVLGTNHNPKHAAASIIAAWALSLAGTPDKAFDAEGFGYMCVAAAFSGVEIVVKGSFR